MYSNVSVIIPTYNRASLVTRTVESALAAVSSGDEILVIDDGSTDETAEVLRPFQDRIRYVQTENAGLNAARDLGIRLSSCPLVALLDSDDEWYSDKLYLQRTVMDAFPEIVFCFSDLHSRFPDGTIVHNVLEIWRTDQWVGSRNARRLSEILAKSSPFSALGDLPKDRTDFDIFLGDIYSFLMEAYHVWACTLMIRKEAAGPSFKFSRNQHQICEDWEGFAQLAKIGPAAYLDCETAIQNIHTGPRLTDVDNLVQVSERIKLLNRLWKADEFFMKDHSSLFQSVLNEQYLRRARYLIKTGRTKEAKEDLKVIGGGPWTYRLLASLPSSLVKTLISMRRNIRRVAAPTT